MLKRLLEFGEIPVKSLIRYLFSIGSFIIVYRAYIFGKALYLTNYYEKAINYIQDGQRWYTYEEVNNLPLGLTGGIIYFIAGLLIWKLICELLYIIFAKIERI